MGKETSKRQVKTDGSSSIIYALGFLGAVVYYISVATSFWTGVLGFLKAVVWPALLVYEALQSLGA